MEWKRLEICIPREKVFIFAMSPTYFDDSPIWAETLSWGNMQCPSFFSQILYIIQYSLEKDDLIICKSISVKPKFHMIQLKVQDLCISWIFCLGNKIPSLALARGGGDFWGRWTWICIRILVLIGSNVYLLLSEIYNNQLSENPQNKSAVAN